MMLAPSLIVRLQQRDRDAFKEVYNACLPTLYNFVLKMVKSPELAEDACHDAFIKLWEHADRLDPLKPIQPFLFEIAKNHLLNLIERSNKEKDIIAGMMKHAEKGVNTTEQNYQFTETSALLADAIEQLPPQRKQIFQLCKQEGFTYEQAAARLQISESTVNNQMVKALKLLKSCLHALFTFL
jgi:RNA polymerase sigma-70 factor (family 1)